LVYIAEKGFTIRGVRHEKGATVDVSTMSAFELERHRNAGRIKEYASDPVTDAAARKAAELGVDIDQVTGSGGGGRVTVSDVEQAAKEQQENE
jgi:pyruvate/2-oxoglutarate dehydrogenase complex dihydrolipoamide acyltransferase (E2) component